jgi:hypothetical protein
MQQGDGLHEFRTTCRPLTAPWPLRPERLFRVLMCRVSDAGPLAVYEAARRAGVRKPSGKEPAVGGVGVAVYGDLAAERLGRVMRWALE